MAASNRASILSRTQKVLDKHYQPATLVERPVLEQLLYAACLEDSRREAADECYARLQESFFDWNEVRVTTIRELTEVMRGLTNPPYAATNVKQTLHSVFEAIYSFDLEPLKKQNLGAAVKTLQQFKGTTPFMISYAVQTCLGGHSVPVSAKGLEVMFILGVINEKERDARSVPGLERAIPKTKGFEFGSLLHQLSADFAASPFNVNTRSILLEVAPDGKDRLPKRGGRKSAESKAGGAKTAATKKKAANKETPGKKVTAKKSAGAKKPEPKKKAPVKKAKAKAKANRPVKKKTSRSAQSGKSITKKAARGAKKSASKQLARRKPR